MKPQHPLLLSFILLLVAMGAAAVLFNQSPATAESYESRGRLAGISPAPWP
jgi:hypothetical protein